MWKTTTGFTPFELVYGKQVVMLTEFEHETSRTTLELNIVLTKAQLERNLQINGLDEYTKSA